ncbi:Uncharacterised protein [Stenotrophomonas maltophilia]|nr:Uncharacterised protein [Stenotrophomonas maltophilia]
MALTSSCIGSKSSRHVGVECLQELPRVSDKLFQLFDHIVYCTSNSVVVLRLDRQLRELRHKLHLQLQNLVAPLGIFVQQDDFIWRKRCTLQTTNQSVAFCANRSSWPRCNGLVVSSGAEGAVLKRQPNDLELHCGEPARQGVALALLRRLSFGQPLKMRLASVVIRANSNGPGTHSGNHATERRNPICSIAGCTEHSYSPACGNSPRRERKGRYCAQHGSGNLVRFLLHAPSRTFHVEGRILA